MPSFDTLTVAELREHCRDKGYVIGGTKDVLIHRLRNRGNDPYTRGPAYEDRTVAELNEVLDRYGLSKQGTKADKIARLRNRSGYC